MGGLGSGRLREGNTQPTVDDVHCIDIHYIKKQGMLHPGLSGILSWSVGDRFHGSVNFRIDYDRLVLDYYSYTHNGEWEPVEETIWFDWTPCHYGGQRLWLRCPGCARRVAVLCGYGERFLCRQCCRLPYASQQRGFSDRMMAQARKIRQRLGITENLWLPLEPGCKPKGMHWHTFDRVVAREKRYNAASLAWLHSFVAAVETRRSTKSLA
jgi:hypothetical protein